jgi:hypothetical protein
MRRIPAKNPLVSRSMIVSILTLGSFYSQPRESMIQQSRSISRLLARNLSTRFTENFGQGAGNLLGAKPGNAARSEQPRASVESLHVRPSAR